MGVIKLRTPYTKMKRTPKTTHAKSIYALAKEAIENHRILRVRYLEETYAAALAVAQKNCAQEPLDAAKDKCAALGSIALVLADSWTCKRREGDEYPEVSLTPSAALLCRAAHCADLGVQATFSGIIELSSAAYVSPRNPHGWNEAYAAWDNLRDFRKSQIELPA